MHASDQRIRGYNQLLAAGNIKDRGIVTDPEYAFPFRARFGACQDTLKSSDQIKLFLCTGRLGHCLDSELARGFQGP